VLARPAVCAGSLSRLRKDEILKQTLNRAKRAGRGACVLMRKSRFTEERMVCAIREIRSGLPF
jgi:hypothetical protein